MQKILRPCPWPTERIAAVCLLSMEEAEGETGRSLSVLSIWKSHRKALMRGLERLKDGSLVVLEDDVTINRKFFGEKLALPDNLPDDWEIILFSPRYRRKYAVGDAEFGKPKWDTQTFRKGTTYIPDIRKNYICNGAHCCVFRDAATIRKIIETMDAQAVKYDVDNFFGHAFRTYGIHTNQVQVGGFGSDHQGKPLLPSIDKPDRGGDQIAL
ncbi:hypothetical protein LGR54_24235 [Ancylobacter sp. Lp-2]|uniref:hypothetical protein n=1 Tax=Ancylobacter sp. Lp-2 TaxID=2881339 RepID=UPI001E379247|nr:hypothetical protein [Ancylobacter sp. Lp-2]MCB4771725.1 hypothetical protein [Ancylobacter sp. Lp-2]